MEQHQGYKKHSATGLNSTPNPWIYRICVSKR